MGRIALLIIVLLFVATVVFVGGSYLVVFWRDTMRKWRLEREADRQKQLKESNEEFIRATEHIKKTNKTSDKTRV